MVALHCNGANFCHDTNNNDGYPYTYYMLFSYSLQAWTTKKVKVVKLFNAQVQNHIIQSFD